jgi:hypothetical protein
VQRVPVRFAVRKEVSQGLRRQRHLTHACPCCLLCVDGLTDCIAPGGTRCAGQVRPAAARRGQPAGAGVLGHGAWPGAALERGSCVGGDARAGGRQQGGVQGAASLAVGVRGLGAGASDLSQSGTRGAATAALQPCFPFTHAGIACCLVNNRAVGRVHRRGLGDLGGRLQQAASGKGTAPDRTCVSARSEACFTVDEKYGCCFQSGRSV